MGGTRAAFSPTRPPAAKCSVSCQGLSKLQELVRYHIYDHGQVRVFLPEGGQLAPEAGLSGVCVWAPAFPGALLLSLPVWATRPQSIVTWKDQVWPQGVWLVPSLRPPSPLPQLMVEKLISKGRILTMANQVLAVNISAEVRSGAPGMNGGAGDEWPVVRPLSDLPSCSKPMASRPWWGSYGRQHRSNPSPGARQAGRAPRRRRESTGWGAPWRNPCDQGTEAGALLPGQEALPRRREGGQQGGEAEAGAGLNLLLPTGLCQGPHPAGTRGRPAAEGGCAGCQWRDPHAGGHPAAPNHPAHPAQALQPGAAQDRGGECTPHSRPC